MELADVVIVGCPPSNAGMSPPPLYISQHGRNLWVDLFFSTKVRKLPCGWKELQAHTVTGDTKAGTLIGTDRYGNKYFENLEDELPCMIPETFASRITISQFCSADKMD